MASQHQIPKLAYAPINIHLLKRSPFIIRSHDMLASILRRASRSPKPLSNLAAMTEASNSQSGFGGGSGKLAALARQLRLYKAPAFEDDEEEERAEESEGKVVAKVGVVESAAPAVVRPERFRAKRAAVLICLFEDDQSGDLRVILTKRSSRLSTHSGEVSLPGGKAEEGDKDDKDTATREAQEEIGLDPSLVNVVAVLEPFLSKHLLRVVPVIGILQDKRSFTPKPNTDEVDAVFDAPLEMFLKDENRRWEEREWLGNNYLIHYFDYGTGDRKFVIWGLTAGILIRAASVVYQRLPEFVEQKPEFKIPKFVSKDTIMP
uniref:Nudix hydrolase domain-containing protein n=1 Tax=Kalanchoe fedtschenkoi TaxID=63787 RepID=A0A7N1A0J1_KALFE